MPRARKQREPPKISDKQARLIRELLTERIVPPEMAWRPFPELAADASDLIDALLPLERIPKPKRKQSKGDRQPARVRIRVVKADG